jgi:hypothetical protein
MEGRMTVECGNGLKVELHSIDGRTEKNIVEAIAGALPVIKPITIRPMKLINHDEEDTETMISRIEYYHDDELRGRK